MTRKRTELRRWWITTGRGPVVEQNKVAGPFLTDDEARDSRERIEKYTGKLTFWIVSEDES